MFLLNPAMGVNSQHHKNVYLCIANCSMLNWCREDHHSDKLDEFLHSLKAWRDSCQCVNSVNEGMIKEEHLVDQPVRKIPEAPFPWNP